MQTGIHGHEGDFNTDGVGVSNDNPNTDTLKPIMRSGIIVNKAKTMSNNIDAQAAPVSYYVIARNQ